MEPSGEEKEDVIGLLEGEVAKAEEIPESGVVIGPGAEEVKKEESDASVGIELGDYVEFHSERADIETVKGNVFYIDDTRISILEEGKSRKVVVFDMEEDEDGDMVFLPEYQLTSAIIRDKRILPSFVAQRGMSAGMRVDTFTADGEQTASYTIESVDEQKDSAVFVDDAGDKLILEFAFKGIPRDKSIAPFDVLRVVEPPKTEVTVPNEAAPGEVQEEFLDFEFLEELQAPEVQEELEGLFQAPKKASWLLSYKDDEQINDMLRERIRELDPAAQRNQRRIREISRLVWSMLGLRNDIISYSGDTPIGRKQVAYTTLKELLEKTEFPLAKQILAVAKAIYVDHTSGDVDANIYGATQDPTSVSDPNILLHYLQDIIIKGERYIDTQLKDSLVTAEVVGGRPTIPRWITVWQGYFNKYFLTVSPLSQKGALKDVRLDQDCFRTEIPGDPEKDFTLPGLPSLDADSDTLVTANEIDKIRYSYFRALSARYGRYGEGGLTHKLEDADSAEIKGYLLFPLQFIRDLGYTRSGILAYDIAYGFTRPKTMDMILQAAGDIVDIPEQNKIISVRFDGGSLGNIEIADWLKGQPLYAAGIGDILPYLRSFGLLQTEITVSQKRVLDSKIALYNAAVKKAIKENRDKIEKERKERKPLRTDTLLNEQRVFELFQSITKEASDEPFLKDLLQEFANRFPRYQRFDVAMFAYLYSQYPDYFINTLAKNPEVARERMRVERDIYIQGILHNLAYDKKLQNAGEPALPNPCQHVKELNKIRKINNNSDRMMSLNIFIRTFKSKKEDHWLWCNNGDPPHHLLCEHEYLLLQEFLRPKEKDVIHKEILLTFGGGKFNGQYICKQCGQPIMDFEYDTHLEFTDENVPMDGRAVLVDQDAIEQEKLQRALTTEAEEEEKVDTRSEEDQKIFLVLSELASLVGIFPDRKSYEIMITRVKNAIALAPNRNKYTSDQKTMKKAGKPTMDYDIFINRIFVSVAAASLLIDVQTHIPDYVVRYPLPGCSNPSFTGYPMDPDMDNDKSKVGMEYLACAISTIMKNTQPWQLTGYQTISSTASRLKEIMLYLKAFTKELAETPEVQQAILNKKQYLLETFGVETGAGRPHDIIPQGFTPTPFITAKELGVEAESPVISETASNEEKVRAYIKQAHSYALKFGKYVPGATHSEASCCYSEIQKPSEFWKSKGELPTLPPHEPPKGTTGSRLYVPMRPRALERIFGKADASIMYRLFLRVCFRGPRVGKQHEPGYDSVCPWCDFKFPEDPRLPPPVRPYDKNDEKQKKLDQEFQQVLQTRREKELQALRDTGVEEIATDTFEDLLTNVNKNGIIPPLGSRVLPSAIDNLEGMLSLLPAPFEGYQIMIRDTVASLKALKNDALRKDVIDAFTSLSIKAVSLEEDLRKRLGDKTFEIYEEFIKLPPQELGENLRTYFLVPFQRILTMKEGSLGTFKPSIKPSTTTEFSSEVIKDLQEAYARHTSYLNDIIKDIPKKDVYIKAKMREVVDRLSVVVPVFIKIVRSTALRGGTVASTFLQRAIVAGIFSEFINPNHIPSNDPNIVAPSSALTTPAKTPARILQACLLKYKQEGLAYTQDQIREMIQDRVEKEKAEIIKKKNKMTPEQRRLDNMLQRYGMGEWAVGGTKAIWRYDPNQYVSEKDAMTAAGIARFGPQMDVYERDGGYDVEQTREDDA